MGIQFSNGFTMSEKPPKEIAYDYYTAVNYNCEDCSVPGYSTTVRFLSGTYVVIDKWYRPTGFVESVYKIVSVTSPIMGGDLLTDTPYNSGCFACNGIIETTTTTTTAAPTTTTTTTQAPITYAVGDSALGGIVAYILQSGDLGYDETVQHGIVAAINASPQTRVWGCYQTIEIVGIEVGRGSIGDGLNATTQINEQCSDRPIAASVAVASNAGYNDWYLPSKDELNKLFLNKVAIGYNTTSTYWSSTQNNASLGTAWTQLFSLGTQRSRSKNINYSVIPIRSF